MNDDLILIPGKDFTTSRLAEFLNEKYGGKRTGTDFLIGDIQQYLRRGYLPKSYGHHPIEFIGNEEIGIKIIRVHFNKTQE
jgi:hypothetical protein